MGKFVKVGKACVKIVHLVSATVIPVATCATVTAEPTALLLALPEVRHQESLQPLSPAHYLIVMGIIARSAPVVVASAATGHRDSATATAAGTSDIARAA